MLYILALRRHNSVVWIKHKSALCSLCSSSTARHSFWNTVERLYSTARGVRTVSYYDVLETTPTATQKQIKASYFRLSKKLHPDVNKASDAKEKFSQLSEAYEVLSNRRTRALYDAGSLSPADLRSSSGEPQHPGVAEEEYQEFFKRRSQFRAKGKAPTGKTQFYDFDEFYRQHYGDSIREKAEGKRMREEREVWERIMYERARNRAITFSLGVLMATGFFISWIR